MKLTTKTITITILLLVSTSPRLLNQTTSQNTDETQKANSPKNLETDKKILQTEESNLKETYPVPSESELIEMMAEVEEKENLNGPVVLDFSNPEGKGESGIDVFRFFFAGLGVFIFF